MYYILNGQLGYVPDELYHHGVKGMKWGVRKKRPESSLDRARTGLKTAKRDYNNAYNSAYDYSRRHPISQWTNKKKRAESDRRWDDAADKAKALDVAKKNYKTEKQAYKNSPEGQARAEKMKKAAKVGAAVAGTALAAYGTYKMAKFIRNKNAQIRIEHGNRVWNDYLSDKLRANNISITSEEGRKMWASVAKTKRSARAWNAEQAAKDSFATATKNVYNYYRNGRLV